MTICEVCENEDQKYKCSACSILYCSVNCFKKHKESKCDELKQQQEASMPQFVEDKNPERLQLFETIDTVPQEKLEELQNSDTLKELLRNPHLRNFLKEVNDAKNPWNAMKLAMKEPLFLEFADECLKVVED